MPHLYEVTETELTLGISPAAAAAALVTFSATGEETILKRMKQTGFKLCSIIAFSELSPTLVTLPLFFLLLCSVCLCLSIYYPSIHLSLHPSLVPSLSLHPSIYLFVSHFLLLSPIHSNNLSCSLSIDLCSFFFFSLLHAWDQNKATHQEQKSSKWSLSSHQASVTHRSRSDDPLHYQTIYRTIYQTSSLLYLFSLLRRFSLVFGRWPNVIACPWCNATFCHLLSLSSRRINNKRNQSNPMFLNQI